MKEQKYIVGIDVGGTFTDVLALDRVSGKIVSAFKVPSTPSDPAEGVGSADAAPAVIRRRQSAKAGGAATARA